MIRIMLADDHAILRQALRALLEQEDDMEVVAEAGDGETALKLVRQRLPDVVVMDVSMPGLDGVETTHQLLKRHPAIKVLALSTHLNQPVIQQMLDAGATGYVVKSSAGGELLQGIRAAMEGRSYLCHDAAALVVDNLRRPPLETAKSPGKPASLSRRELQILCLIAEGKSSPLIADQLYISPNTVEVHRRNIMRKLQLHNVAELTKYAIREGLTAA